MKYIVKSHIDKHWEKRRLWEHLASGDWAIAQEHPSITSLTLEGKLPKRLRFFGSKVWFLISFTFEKIKFNNIWSIEAWLLTKSLFFIFAAPLRLGYLCVEELTLRAQVLSRRALFHATSSTSYCSPTAPISLPGWGLTLFWSFLNKGKWVSVCSEYFCKKIISIQVKTLTKWTLPSRVPMGRSFTVFVLSIFSQWGELKR